MSLNVLYSLRELIHKIKLEREGAIHKNWEQLRDDSDDRIIIKTTQANLYKYFLNKIINLGY